MSRAAAATLREILSLCSLPSATSPHVLSSISALLSSVTSADLGYPAHGEPLAPCTVHYRPLADSAHASIGVFELGRGASMPLHDHPGAVVSHILFGSVRVASFDALADGANLNELGSTTSARFAGSARIGAGAGVPRQWLTHETGNNIHSFRAEDTAGDGMWGGGCAILDVVLPPYEGSRHNLSRRARAAAAPVTHASEDRLCTYYAVLGEGGSVVDAFDLAEHAVGSLVTLRTLTSPPPEPLERSPPLAAALLLQSR